MAEQKTLTVKLVRSAVCQVPKDQTRTVHSLGLKKIGDTHVLPDNPGVRGTIFKVKHLVEVTEN
ncbi:MAG: 50S ribosomal protein L30 [Coriobacteriales bacterium]|nr:50S ribosomal protein L30 [Coriobacteriales bacterium]